MNKYTRALIDFPTAILKVFLLKLNHAGNFKFYNPIFMSPLSELTLDKGGKISIGQRSMARIRVRKNAKLVIGNNISLNHGCMLVAHDNIKIGDDVQFGPNVLLYDHDPDYKAIGGIQLGNIKHNLLK